jgi:hypothetical protein
MPIAEGKKRISMTLKRRREWWVFRQHELNPNNHHHYGYSNPHDMFLLRFHEQGRLVSIYVQRNGRVVNQYQDGNRASSHHIEMATEIMKRRPVVYDPNQSDEYGELVKCRTYRPVRVNQDGSFQSFVDDQLFPLTLSSVVVYSS